MMSEETDKPAEELDPWASHEDFPVEDWLREVAGGDTRLGYHPWLRAKREEKDGGPSREDLAAAMKAVNDFKLELGLKVKKAVEEICREAEKRGVLPVISVATSPETACEGLPRSVTAHVAVDLKLLRS